MQHKNTDVVVAEVTSVSLDKVPRNIYIINGRGSEV